MTDSSASTLLISTFRHERSSVVRPKVGKRPDNHVRPYLA